MEKFHKLSEASLTRAYQHVIDKKVPSWGMATAYRYSNTPKENKALNKQLEAECRAKGLGFFKIDGHWRECQDASIKYEDCPSDKLVDSTEETLFIPGASKEFMTNIAKKYNQDAVVYGGKDTKGNAHLIFREGGDQNIGKFHPNQTAQAFSKFKNKEKTFLFMKGKKAQSAPTKAGAEKQQASLKKLSSMIPVGALDKRIKNPETGRNIKVKTALGYDKTSPAYKTAFAAIKKPKK
jgi:hypothetical protein